MLRLDQDLIKSGHAAFDKQTNNNYIGAGNVFANTQVSSYIRPHTQTECEGFQFVVGHLNKTDLDMFKDMPRGIRKRVEEMTRDCKGILYQFFHRRGRERVIHGFVLTDENHKLLARFRTGPTHKSDDVLDAVMPYITEQGVA